MNVRGGLLNKYFDAGFDLGGPIVRDKAVVLRRVPLAGDQELDYRHDQSRRELPHRSHGALVPVAEDQLAAGTQPAGVRVLSDPAEEAIQAWPQRAAPRRDDERPSARPKSQLYSFRYDWTPKAESHDQHKRQHRGRRIRAGGPPGRRHGHDSGAQLDQATGLWCCAPPNLFGVEEERRTFGATVDLLCRQLARRQARHQGRASTSSQENYFGNQGGGALTTYPADHRLLFFNGQPLEVILFQSGAQNITQSLTVGLRAKTRGRWAGCASTSGAVGLADQPAA